MDIIYSQQDNSVNFIDNSPEIGFFESRYVRRGEDYFIVYLSVQSGCDLGCRMCHLTNTKQNKFVNSDIEGLLKQANAVLAHYVSLVESGKEKPAKHVHFNFMARGEVLNSPIFNDKNLAYKTLSQLRNLGENLGLNVRFLLSTIIPESFEDKSFSDLFQTIHPYFYYSLYSLNPDFRKVWLSKSLEPKKALIKLAEWAKQSEHQPKIHFAFIKDKNDSEQDILDICKFLKEIDFKPDFNIVRYNPYSEKYGEEPCESVINRNADIIRKELGVNVKIIPRVGKDVKASCGMFIEK